MHCIYDFGLAVTTQGAKQIMLGDKVFNYGPGESMLTPIDLPIRSVQIQKHLERCGCTLISCNAVAREQVPDFYRQVKLAASSMLPEPV